MAVGGRRTATFRSTTHIGWVFWQLAMAHVSIYKTSTLFAQQLRQITFQREASKPASQQGRVQTIQGTHVQNVLRFHFSVSI